MGGRANGNREKQKTDIDSTSADNATKTPKIINLRSRIISTASASTKTIIKTATKITTTTSTTRNQNDISTSNDVDLKIVSNFNESSMPAAVIEASIVSVQPDECEHREDDEEEDFDEADILNSAQDASLINKMTNLSLNIESLVICLFIR